MRRPEELAAALHHRFRNAGLLCEALTHGSAAGPDRASYERLEFLGDRVLGLIVADLLYARFPDENQGALARRHAALVCRDALARVAGTLELGRYMILSPGEEESGGRVNPALLADCCEAVIAALYLDGGLTAARAFITAHWEEPMEEAAATPPQDAKTALQEWAQGRAISRPDYVMISQDGPPHDPVFEIEVRVGGQVPVVARASSKRLAEQRAAAEMLARLRGQS